MFSQTLEALQSSQPCSPAYGIQKVVLAICFRQAPVVPKFRRLWSVIWCLTASPVASATEGISTALQRREREGFANNNTEVISAYLSFLFFKSLPAVLHKHHWWNLLLHTYQSISHCPELRLYFLSYLQLSLTAAFPNTQLTAMAAHLHFLQESRQSTLH